MKSSALIVAVLAIALLAACGSTPPKDAAGGAPIEDRTGSKPGAGGPGVGTIGGPGGPATIDISKPGAAGGVDPAVKQGVLAQRSVFFDFDSDAIREEFRPMLQAHAQYLARNRAAKMLVQGNTDERGGREYNLALGQRRAEAVKKMLTLLGAGDAQIEAVSLGEEKPRRTGSSEESYRENRRGDLLHNGEF